MGRTARRFARALLLGVASSNGGTTLQSRGTPSPEDSRYVLYLDEPLKGTYDQALAACAAAGGSLADDEGLLRRMCAQQRRTTCWVHRYPRIASNGERLCSLMTQDGDVPRQLCQQRIGFVCDVPSSAQGPLRWLAPESEKSTFDQASARCGSLGGRLESDEAAVRALCSAAGVRTTCWVGKPALEPAAGRAERLCGMLSQEGDPHFQGCNQRLRFVCSLTRRSPPMPPRPPAPPPSPPPVPLLGTDNHTYLFLYDTADYETAALHCSQRGAMLAHYDPGVTPQDASTLAVRGLCVARRVSCWVGNRLPIRHKGPATTPSGELAWDSRHTPKHPVCRLH
ncbi:hypothetical protein HYH03_011722 [Edaphochlamys debaryana]|uniref:Uncharacterized protein n=1 Tax=Edaphochlamys debaryana TaxID=47281 RepID=A0A835XWR7_9CHLO|nr:hypothetical protein HYH03_011722 [Edaphochlamys debaryana]|eukprot:KAG2489771.1 hypothetical protein HYH03_011722 [Edaphochlamys debaryana]